jgi:DNA-binding protein HU-beta
MTKKQFAEKVVEVKGYKKKDIELAKTDIKTVVDFLLKNLSVDGKVQVEGLGAFEKVHKEERKGRNPQTKEEITVPACDTITFKIDKDLKAGLNK